MVLQIVRDLMADDRRQVRIIGRIGEDALIAADMVAGQRKRVGLVAGKDQHPPLARVAAGSTDQTRADPLQRPLLGTIARSRLGALQFRPKLLAHLGRHLRRNQKRGGRLAKGADAAGPPADASLGARRQTKAGGEANDHMPSPNCRAKALQVVRLVTKAHRDPP